MKVLVVEDEIYSRQSMVKQIRELDSLSQFEILEAADGKQGWELFRKDPAGIVFTDIRMPFLGGLELLKLILENHPETKVVMVSGYADFEYARDALNLGALGYLLKPVKSEDLSNILQKFLLHRAEQAETIASPLGDTVTQHIRRVLSARNSAPDYIGDTVFQRVFPAYRFLYLQFEEDAENSDDFQSAVRNLQVDLPEAEFRMLEAGPCLWEMVLRENNKIPEQARKAAAILGAGKSEFRVSMGEPHAGAQSLKAASRQALHLLKHKIFSAAWLLDPKVEEGRDHSFSPDKGRLDILRLHLEKGGAEGTANAFAVVHADLRELFADPRSTLSGLEAYLRRLSGILQEVQCLQSPQGDHIFSDSGQLDFNLLDFNCEKDLLAAVKTKIEAVGDMGKEKGALRQDAVVEAVLAYIDTNYDKDVSLKHLAETVFFMNHSYLSHLISEQTGSSFSAYLQQVRIAKAKLFLQDCSLSITEVSALSGYNDTSRFIQVFKKVVGVTPKKFRSQILSNMVK